MKTTRDKRALLISRYVCTLLRIVTTREGGIVTKLTTSVRFFSTQRERRGIYIQEESNQQ
jgi:hypothetical protein